MECSATDLIGQYVGQTGPKTIKQLERGLGKVLFIDEAYRLGEGLFAQEAINELVDTITKPKFAGKLVIILAGYDNDINNLLQVNEGLSSRFADEIIFPALSSEHCLQLLEEKLKQNRISIPALHNPVTYQNLLRPMAELSSLRSWGNARDVQTLAKNMVRTVFKSIKNSKVPLVLSDEKAVACIQTMLSERQRRNNAVPRFQQLPPDVGQAQTQNSSRHAPITQIGTSGAKCTENENKEHCRELPSEISSEQMHEDDRDDGVSDVVWAQLQNDKRAAELEAKRCEQLLRDEEEACRAAEDSERKSAAAAAALQAIQAKNEAGAMELMRQREEARISALEAKAAREKIQRELEKRRVEELERKRKETQTQMKLRRMGICPAGFQWIKQSGGYRCTAGGHFVSDGQLGM